MVYILHTHWRLLLKDNKMCKIKLSSAVFALMICGVSNAELIKLEGAGNCNLSDVKITSIKAVLTNGPELVKSGDLDSTKCLGFVSTPSNDWGNNPSPNLGGFEDGLLNGEIVNGKGQNKGNEYYVAGDEFLTNINDSMVDIDGFVWVVRMKINQMHKEFGILRTTL
jgi:hypothetical protein